MDSTYAPRSPDLSSFLSSPPKTQQPYLNLSHQPQSSYAPRSPQVQSLDSADAHHPPYNQSIHGYQVNLHPSTFESGGGNFGFSTPGTRSQYIPPIPALPASHSFQQTQAQAQYNGTSSAYSYQPPFQPQLQQQDLPHPPLKKAKTEPRTQPRSSRPSSSKSASTNMPPGRPRGSRNEASSSTNPPPPRKDPNPTNIEIRTKFPVARIKRIMQADEEVGKVAQVTPVAVNKALELFMIALVSGAAEKAKEKGGKKVTAQHLKSVVLGSPDQFDFLSEIVERVSEAQEGAGGGKRKAKGNGEGGSDESSTEEGAKKKKGRGRKKKSEA